LDFTDLEDTYQVYDKISEGLVSCDTYGV
jgi:hypothetical protein